MTSELRRLSLVLLVLLLGCSAEEEVPEERRPIPVAVEPLATGPARATVTAWGTVEPIRDASLLAGVSGTVTAVHARLGDRVAEDAPLLEIDPEVFASRAEEARVRVESAALAVEKTNKDLERNRKLYEDGNVISETALEAARVEAIKARAEQAAARATRAQAELAYRDARPTAPFAGSVANALPDAGTSVMAGTLLARVVDISRVKVRAGFSEQDLATIRPGSMARLTVESLEREFEGEVTAVGPAADPASFLFPVEITVENPAGLPLRGGMVARVEVVTESWEDAPLLPVDALVERPEGVGYYVVDGGVAAWRAATVLARTREILVLDGTAAPGDSVVILGQTRLTPGTPVTIEARP
jgi:RND family efflux transporter MFP subunit